MHNKVVSLVKFRASKQQQEKRDPVLEFKLHIRRLLYQNSESATKELRRMFRQEPSSREIIKDVLFKIGKDKFFDSIELSFRHFSCSYIEWDFENSKSKKELRRIRKYHKKKLDEYKKEHPNYIFIDTRFC